MKFLAALFLIGQLFITAPAMAADAKTAAPNEIRIDKLDKIIGVSRLWKEADYNFSYFDHVPDLDWDAEYRTALDEARKTRNAYEYYRVLQKFIAKLKDDHTRIDLPQALADKYLDAPRLRLEEVAHQAVVTNVDVKLADEVPVGSVILKVDGKPVADVLRDDVLPYLAATREAVAWARGITSSRYRGAGIVLGMPGSTIRLKIERPDGSVRTVRLTRDRYRHKDDVKWSVKPPSDESLTFKEIEPEIGYVDINGFMDSKIPEKFEALLPKLEAMNGIILDLRDNAGGNSANAYYITAHLTKKPLLLPRGQTRKHIAAFKALGQLDEIFPGMVSEEELAPYKPYAEGKVWESDDYTDKDRAQWPPKGELAGKPVVVLTNIFTASAAELFLATIKPLPDVTLVGQGTNGDSGQPLWVFLPGGGRARISSERAMTADGWDFTGVGFTPDVEVAATVDDIRNHRDPVLAAGVSELKKKIGGEASR